MNPVPVIVTVFPPAGGPLVGLIDVIAGGGTYVYVTAFDVPSTVATVTFTVTRRTGRSRHRQRRRRRHRHRRRVRVRT